MSESHEIATELSETVQKRLEGLSPETRQKFDKLLERLKGTAKVYTAPAGTQYVYPVDILLSTKVLKEMQDLTDAVGKAQKAAV